MNKGCRSFQSVVSPSGQVISHGSEVPVLELLSLSPALCPKYCLLLCVYTDSHTSKAARDRQKCAQAELFTLSVCNSPPATGRTGAQNIRASLSGRLVPYPQDRRFGVGLKPGFGHIMLIGDVRQHCCSPTADRSLGLKKSQVLGEAKAQW